MKKSIFSGGPLNWGLSTLGCPEKTLAEAVEIADEFGIRFVEIRAISNSVKLHETLAEPGNRAALEKLAAAKRVLALGSSFGIASPDRALREEMGVQAKIADAFEIPYIRVFGGCKPDMPVAGAVLDQVRENLAWFDALGLEHTRMALETHDGFSSAARCAELFDRLGRRLPVIWDSHHTWRHAHEPMPEAWRLLKETIVDIHFKDSTFPEGAPKVHAELPGEGDLPLTELFRMLAAEGFTGPVTLEYERMWHPYLPELRLALAATEKVVRAAFPA